MFSLKRVCVLMGSPFPSLFTLLYPWVWTFVACRISVIFLLNSEKKGSRGEASAKGKSHMR